jgi:hypothetical protein
MSDMDFDPELTLVADRVARLGLNVEIDGAHRSELRRQILQRHHELTADSRSTRWRWPRLAPLSRLAVLGPSAVAAAAVVTAALWGIEATGNRSTQAVEAQRLTTAMVRTAPTVTGWKWTVTNHLANSTRFAGFTTPLTGRVYLYKYSGKLIPYWRVNGEWKGVPIETRGSLRGTDWQWAFAQLPVRLAEHQARVLPRMRRIDGKDAVGVEYELSGGSGVQVRAIAWVEASAGKILLLEREVLHGTRVVEQDSVRYLYQRGSK